MKRSPRRVLIRAMVSVVRVVVFYFALLFFAQRWLIFPAPAPAPAAAFELPAPAGVKALRLTIDSGSIEAWYLPPSISHSGPAPLLIFTHGNGELASQDARGAPMGDSRPVRRLRPRCRRRTIDRVWRRRS